MELNLLPVYKPYVDDMFLLIHKFALLLMDMGHGYGSFYKKTGHNRYKTNYLEISGKTIVKDDYDQNFKLKYKIYSKNNPQRSGLTWDFSITIF